MTTSAEAGAGARLYRIFDVALRSDIPLTGLRESEDAKAALTVLLGSGPPDDAEFERVHEWKNAVGAVVTVCARRGGDYLLRFPRLADFLLYPEKSEITAFPATDTTTATTAHLLLDQVIPRLLCHQGRVIMHASAVLLPDGRAVAFLGDSGRGKSTLAASFYGAGLGLVTDDCLLLDLRDGSVTGTAAYPSLRLWPAAVERVFADDSGFESVAHYTDKRQLVMRGTDDGAVASLPLAALFVLGEPAAAPEQEVEIRLLGGAVAAMALIEAAFTLDVDRRSAVQENFGRVARIADAGVPVHRLNYPRRFEQLAAVREAILRKLAA